MEGCETKDLFFRKRNKRDKNQRFSSNDKGCFKQQITPTTDDNKNIVESKPQTNIIGKKILN
jgi:hypothetical protein